MCDTVGRVILMTYCLLLLSGCGPSGPKTAIVKGKVTFKGKPVPHGTVTYVPHAGPSATGELQPDGSYTLTTTKPGDGAVLGEHKVVVTAMEDTSGRLPEQRTPLPPPIVPNKYTSVATTDLKAEVKDEVNIHNFNLEGEKGK